MGRSHIVDTKYVWSSFVESTTMKKSFSTQQINVCVRNETNGYSAQIVVGKR